MRSGIINVHYIVVMMVAGAVVIYRNLNISTVGGKLK